jgi:hypothetical protein
MNHNVDPQVDNNGYAKQEEYVKAVDKLHIEGSLNSALKTIIPGCVTKANSRAKGEHSAKKLEITTIKNA